MSVQTWIETYYIDTEVEVGDKEDEKGQEGSLGEGQEQEEDSKEVDGDPLGGIGSMMAQEGVGAEEMEGRDGKEGIEDEEDRREDIEGITKVERKSTTWPGGEVMGATRGQ